MQYARETVWYTSTGAPDAQISFDYALSDYIDFEQYCIQTGFIEIREI